MTTPEVIELVTLSRAAQGLPARITDPTAIARLAGLLAFSHATTKEPAPAKASPQEFDREITTTGYRRTA